MVVEALHTGACKTRFIRVDLKTRHRGASNVKTPSAVLVIVIMHQCQNKALVKQNRHVKPLLVQNALSGCYWCLKGVAES